jgi:hypothetical protein
VLVLGGVEHHEPGVGLLGHVHGDVGALQQLLAGAGVLGIQHHPDAGLDIQGEPFDLERRVEPGGQLLGDLHRAFGGGDLGQQDGELVATQASHRIDGPERTAQPLADLHQQQVTVVVAEGVVDLLEAVQVQQQQRSRHQLPVGLPDGLVDAIVQQGPVGQAGEPVVQRLVLVVGRLAFGAPLIADHDQPEHPKQHQPDREHDRRDDLHAARQHLQVGQRAQGLHALVLGGLPDLTLHRVKQRLAVTVQRFGPPRVAGINGNQHLAHRVLVAVVLGPDHGDIAAVVRVAALVHVSQRLA